MNPHDRREFLEILVGFAEIKGRSLSAPAIELYWRAMQAWTLHEFRAAAEHLLRTEQYFPTPAHFEALRKAGRQTAGEVWAGIRAYLSWSLHGYRLKPGTPDRIAKAISACGGAHAIAMADVEKLGFLERRFCEHFDEIAERTDAREALPQLTAPDRNRLERKQ